MKSFLRWRCMSNAMMERGSDAKAFGEWTVPDTLSYASSIHFGNQIVKTTR